MPMLASDAVFASQPAEHTLRPTRVDGRIPRDLAGTLLRAGPGLLEVGRDVVNFFDGHALVAGLSFQDGVCAFRSRFVRTPLYAEETAAARMTQRRFFTNLPARWSNLFALSLGNNAMHDVYAWGDRVVAGNDPGHFALDPATLDTRGRESWGGAAARGMNQSPMPYPDPATGRLVGYVVKNGKTRPDELSFVELDADFRAVAQTPFHALSRSPAFLHDHRATAAWYVVVEQAATLSVPSLTWGARTGWESLRWGPSATLLLVPRNGAGPLVRVPLPAPTPIAFHVINAFDDDAQVVVDLVTYDAPIAFSAAAPSVLRARLGVRIADGPLPTPRRFIVDPATGTVVRHERLGSVPGEAPEVRDDRMGRRYRYAYLAAPGDGVHEDRGAYFLYRGLSRVDVESGETRLWSDLPTRVVSPPAFVARPGSTDEDDGWLLAWSLDFAGAAPEAAVIVLDAQDIERGPVARVHLDVALPGVSHVRWAPGLALHAD